MDRTYCSYKPERLCRAVVLGVLFQWPSVGFCCPQFFCTSSVADSTVVVSCQRTAAKSGTWDGREEFMSLVLCKEYRLHNATAKRPELKPQKL